VWLIGAPVRQRQLNHARTQSRPFQELLQYYARFLYRLAKFSFADRFILKGAMLLTAWRAPLSRPPMDIDLPGRTDNALDHIAKACRRSVCDLCGANGIEFNRASIEVSRIKEAADYDAIQARNIRPFLLTYHDAGRKPSAAIPNKVLFIAVVIVP
jgi:Nucleotidyl transferase AbiEii toxin, Type IV TA system